MCSCMPCRALGNGHDINLGDFTIDDWTVPQPSNFAPSAKVNWGRKSARMTKTSWKGIGLDRARVTSVSHCAHASGSLPPLESCTRVVLELLPWTIFLALAHIYAADEGALHPEGESGVPVARLQRASPAGS